MQQSPDLHDIEESNSDDSDTHMNLKPSPFRSTDDQEPYLFTSQLDLVNLTQTPNRTTKGKVQEQTVKCQKKTTKKRIQSKFISDGQLKESDARKQKPIQVQLQTPVKKKPYNNKKLAKMVMKELKPQNLEKEKEKFFELNGLYDPQFDYQNQQNLENQFLVIPHQKYANIALNIIKNCQQDFGDEKIFSEIEGGPLMDITDVEDYFEKYMEEFSVRDLISYEFSPNTVAPTSVIHSNQDNTSRVVIGLPITYRQNRIQGVLDHEIGTHFVRKYNDKKQIWYKKRNKYNLQPHLKNEEGLAVLNQTVSIALRENSKPYLYTAAVHYIAAIMAANMSFSQLYQQLADYLVDSEKRFRECLRVKRGMTDTSLKGGMYKDQVYLIGAIKVLKYRQKLNFYNLHAGKITVKDCLRLTEKGLINTEKIKIPIFLRDLNQYRKALDRIAEVNDIYF